MINLIKKKIVLLLFYASSSLLIPCFAQEEVTAFCTKGKKVKCSNGRKARCGSGYQPICLSGKFDPQPDCCKKVFTLFDDRPDFRRCKPSLLQCKKGSNTSTDTGIDPICENGEIKCSVGKPSCSNSKDLGDPVCITLPDSSTFPGCQSTDAFHAEEATCIESN